MQYIFSGAGVSAADSDCRTVRLACAPRRPRGSRFWSSLIGLVLLGGGAWGQDSLRVSLAGQAAAEAKKLAMENQRFNVRLGPVKVRLVGQWGLEATDNVRSTGDQDAEADLILRPRLNVVSLWRVTEDNSLNLSLGVGYDKYFRTADYDNLFISPDSDLSFDLYVKDFVINLHSRFSYSQDVAGDPTISGIGRLSRFENTTGVRTTWSLNKAVLTAAYDHEVYLPTEPGFSQYGRSSDLGTISAAFQVHPILFAGLQVGGGLSTYDDQGQTANNHYSAGPLLALRLSDYTSVRVTGGYVSYFIDSRTASRAASQLDAFYFDLSLRQRVAKSLSHSFSAGRQLQSGFFSTTTDQYYLRYSANWRLFRKTALNTTLSYQNISEQRVNLSGGLNENIGFYGFGFTLSRPLTRRLTGSLSYQFYLRDSDVDIYDYTQNRLALNLIYAF